MPRYRPSKHLIHLRRDGEVLVLNAAEILPLYFRRGGERVLSALSSIGDGASGPELERRVGDKQVADMLVAHRVVVPADDPEDYSFPSCGPVPQAVATSGPLVAQAASGPLAATCVSLYLLLTQGCNLRCVYCYNGEETYQRQCAPPMDERTATRAVERLAGTVAPQGTLEIVFFGGEPLLNWPLAKKVITYCEESLKPARPYLAVRYHLTSNLTLLPKDLVEWATRYRMSFLCDVDGPPDLHDRTRPFAGARSSHRATARTIRALLDHGLSVALRATVTNVNVGRMPDIAAHHRELGGSSCAFVPVNAVNSDEDVLTEKLLPDPQRYVRGFKEVVEAGVWPLEQLFPLNEFLSRIRPGSRNYWACGAPLGNTPVVDVTGDVYACIYLVGISRYKLGNVFSEAPYPDPEVSQRIRELIHIDNHPQCRTCQLRYLCGGGCPVGRLLIASNPRASQAVRDYTQQMACLGNQCMIELALWRLAEGAWNGLPDGLRSRLCTV